MGGGGGWTLCLRCDNRDIIKTLYSFISILVPFKNICIYVGLFYFQRRSRFQKFLKKVFGIGTNLASAMINNNTKVLITNGNKIILVMMMMMMLIVITIIDNNNIIQKQIFLSLFFSLSTFFSLNHYFYLPAIYYLLKSNNKNINMLTVTKTNNKDTLNNFN